MKVTREGEEDTTTTMRSNMFNSQPPLVSLADLIPQESSLLTLDLEPQTVTQFPFHQHLMWPCLAQDKTRARAEGEGDDMRRQFTSVSVPRTLHYIQVGSPYHHLHLRVEWMIWW